MSKVFRIVLAICLFSGGLPAFACSGYTCGPDTVQVLYTTAAGTVYVRPSSGVTGLTCTPIGVYVVLNATGPDSTNSKEIFSALLAAKIAGTSVTIGLDNTQSTCTISYVLNN